MIPLNMGMDSKLDKALEFVNYRATLNNKKAELQARVDTLLTYSINGGTFSINPQLITWTKHLLDLGKTEVVMLDNNNLPIKVVTEDFLEEITGRWFEVTNEYHREYEEIRRKRNVKSILDLE